MYCHLDSIAFLCKFKHCDFYYFLSTHFKRVDVCEENDIFVERHFMKIFSSCQVQSEDLQLHLPATLRIIDISF